MQNIKVSAGHILSAAATLLIASLMMGCASSPSVDLSNTKWTLTVINGQPVPAGVMPTITFAGGKVNGSAGCNSYGGDYRLDGDRLVFTTPLASTMMACVETERMTVEQTFLAALGTGVRVSLANGQVTLTGDNGTTLVFTSQ